MSLKTWYPFDGNIKNHGTGSEKIAAYGTVTYNAGKVTDKSFATGATYLKSQYGYIQNDKLTIAMWVNPNTTTLWTDIISYGSGSNRIELSDASGRYTWYCNDSTALCASGTHLFTIPVNTWHHIAVTADGSKVCFYLDGALTLEKLEAMTCVCSVGLDMIAVPGSTPATTIAGIIADEAAIGMINQKTTAVRIIPVIGKGVGETVEFGGLLGYAPIMPVNPFSCDAFVNRGGRIPAPIHSFKN